MAKRKASPAAKSESALPLVLGAAAVLGVGYLLLKSSPAAAAEPSPPPPPPPPGGAIKTCADGRTTLASATCMKKCPGTSTEVPETDACPAPPPTVAPVVTHYASSPPLPPPPPLAGLVPSTTLQALPLPAIPGLTFAMPSFPLYAPTNDPNDKSPLPINPTDALVYLQGFTAAGQPVYPGIVYPTVILQGADVANATNIVDLLDLSPTKPNLSPYFASPTVDGLETPGSFVLVWSSDTVGNILGWWLMNWSKP